MGAKSFSLDEERFRPRPKAHFAQWNRHIDRTSLAKPFGVVTAPMAEASEDRQRRVAIEATVHAEATYHAEAKGDAEARGPIGGTKSDRSDSEGAVGAGWNDLSERFERGPNQSGCRSVFTLAAGAADR